MYTGHVYNVKLITSNTEQDEEKNTLQQRQWVHRLHFEDGLSKTQIAKQTGLSKRFVMNWTKSLEQDLTVDNRGWPKGQGRLWDDTVKQRIAKLHHWLNEQPKQFYTGASAIHLHYRQRYPGSDVPPLRTIGRILKELGLSQPHRPKAKGAARYLCYPEYTVYETLGTRILEADFIGKKYLSGRSEPVNFIGFSYKKPPKLRYFQRIEAQSTDAIIKSSTAFFKTFGYPDVMKVDNAQATIGSSSGKRSLSRFMVFLLKHNIYPVFSVPRKPFSQASIEGNNSVFSRKFWNSQSFDSLRQLDTRLGWFNQSSLEYTGYDITKRRRRRSKKDFKPKVYFIRQVQEDDNHKGFIAVMNETIPVRKTYINYFVLAEWDLGKQMLNVVFEKEKQCKVIKSIDFIINPNSKYKLI